MTDGDVFRPTERLSRILYDAFQAEARKRNGRAVQEWLSAERHAVLAAAVDEARRRCWPEPTLEMVERAERMAEGHVDYGAQWSNALARQMERLAESQATLQVADEQEATEYTALGYTNVARRGEALCGLAAFGFTHALVVGLTPEGYERRYCFERKTEAMAAILAWDGNGHPPGPWIKCKGAGIDLLNPALD